MNVISKLLYVFFLSFIGLTSLHAQDTPPIEIWTRFNTDNPQVTSDYWLADLLSTYQQEEQATVNNTFYPYDQINTAVNVAVQTGVNVPDLAYIDTEQIGFYAKNEALIDLTDFIQNAEWFNDLDSSALKTCTTPDGQILCVPSTTSNYYMYYWTDNYPTGFPQTTDAVLEIAPQIQNDGQYTFTFKAAEPVSVERFYAGLMLSYGADLAGEDGTAVWANEESVAALTFVRTLFAEDYVPQVALAPQFEYEEPFKQGLAGGFVAGTFSYVYLSPIISPSGIDYAQEITGGFDDEGLSIGQAYDDGAIQFAPPIAAPDGEPVSIISGEGWAIPYGATNIDAALAFIDYQMTVERNVEASIAGGKLPVLTSAQEHPAYQSDYWQYAIGVRDMYGIPAPAWQNYGIAQQLLSEAIVKIITNPDLDIMTVLQEAQDEYNLLIADF